PVHALGDRLDHQVAVLEALQAQLVIGRNDGGGERLRRQRGRLELAEVGNGAGDGAVGVALLGGKVEQHGVDAGVDEVGGDLGAHHACAEHGGTAYKQFLRHVLQLLDWNVVQLWMPAAVKRISSSAARLRWAISLTPEGRLISPKSDIA